MYLKNELSFLLLNVMLFSLIPLFPVSGEIRWGDWSGVVEVSGHSPASYPDSGKLKAAHRPLIRFPSSRRVTQGHAKPQKVQLKKSSSLLGDFLEGARLQRSIHVWTWDRTLHAHTSPCKRPSILWVAGNACIVLRSALGAEYADAWQECA